MQELLADLLPYLAAFYLLELVANPGRHHQLFVKGLGRWRVLGQGLGLVPLAPGAEAIAATDLPLLCSEEGVWLPLAARAYSPRVFGPEDLEFIAFERLQGLEAERKKVLLDGRLLLKAPTPAAARALVARLSALRALPAAERAAELERVARAESDVPALRKRRQAQESFATWIRAGAWLLAGLFFLLLPWQVYCAPQLRLDLGRLVLDGLALLAINGSLAAGMLHRLGLRPKEISAQVATLLLLPFSALHPFVHLSRDLYLRFHWAALSAVLLPRAQFKVRARQELRRLSLSIERSRGTPLEKAWARERSVWHRVLAESGEPLEPLLADPPSPDPSARSYCPLCSASFREGAQRCADCGTELRPVGKLPAAKAG